MISARLRFVALVTAAVTAAAMAGLYAQSGLLIPGTLPCLIAAAFLAEAAAYVRRAAHRLQDQHHQALLRVREHCGHQPPLFSAHSLGTECVLQASHQGSHADDSGMRWWAVGHAFEQHPQAESVQVCCCGKWPNHHIHTGDTAICSCDACRAARTTEGQSR